MAVSHWHFAFACALSVACGVDTTGLGKPDGSSAGSPSAAAGANGSSAGAGGAKDSPPSSAGSPTQQQDGGAGGTAAAGMPGAAGAPAAGAPAAGAGGSAATECKLSSQDCRACMISNCYPESVACAQDKACNDSGDPVVDCYCTAHKSAADCTDGLGDISKDLAACMMLQCEDRCL